MIRAKARPVARGFKQGEGIDFSETLPRRLRRHVFRMLGAIACELVLDLCHFDAGQGFVQSTLQYLRLEASVEIVAQPPSPSH